MKKVYYAHFMGIYNTPQETRDIIALKSLGLEVLNPNTPKIQQQVDTTLERLKLEDSIKTSDIYMKMFTEVFLWKVEECEVFAFKALPDGRIPGGVAMELEHAQKHSKIIIELPSGMHARKMGKEDTREYLRDIGQR